jgi:hypothetical protein
MSRFPLPAAWEGQSGPAIISESTKGGPMGPQPSTTSPTDIDRALEQGWSSLRRRDWRQARDAFQQVLDAEAVSPVAWEGLAIAALCLGDAVRSRSANERAYREYLKRHDSCGAARVAIQLGVYHDAYRGESAIASAGSNGRAACWTRCRRRPSMRGSRSGRRTSTFTCTARWPKASQASKTRSASTKRATSAAT